MTVWKQSILYFEYKNLIKYKNVFKVRYFKIFLLQSPMLIITYINQILEKDYSTECLIFTLY
jgi:hypothetical protein